MSQFDFVKKRAIKSILLPMLKDLDLKKAEKEIIEEVKKQPLQEGEKYHAALLYASGDQIMVTAVAMDENDCVKREIKSMPAQQALEFLLSKI